jgi:site-specific DNA-methyltransferase (adenine-specific)
MGKTWDGGDIALRAETWRLVYDCLRPGAYLLAFGGTRTWHRQAVAIEDAGFEIRDTIMWLYGSGFPKSHNAGDGWGTALKPAVEPIVLARKPLIGTVAANVAQFGTGAINIDASRLPDGGVLVTTGNGKRDRQDGYGMQGGIIGGSPLGRWPANVIHDGSDEVEEAFAAFGEAPGQQFTVGPQHGKRDSVNVYGDYGERPLTLPRGDTGTASRFFYTAKASAADRAGSKHPTVKPTDLMRYLVQMVTPKGGTVLDPFAGSGSTGLAADQLGCDAVLIERDPGYAEDIQRKITGDCPLFAEVSA